MRKNFTFERAGISYKQALPPEDWPYMEKFLRTFLTYADRAQELGIKPDVGLFLSEYCKGGQRRRHKVTEHDLQKMAELKAQGYKKQTIARMLGLWLDSVRYYTKKGVVACQTTNEALQKNGRSKKFLKQRDM